MSLELEDKYQVPSPDKVEINLNLAGLGSRALAYFIDGVIKILGMVIIIFLFIWGGRSIQSYIGESKLNMWFLAVFMIFVAVIYTGYSVFLEALWNGQTIGKKMMKIRVVMDNGQSLSLFSVLVRNLLRLVDMLPTNYLVGGLALLLSQKNQRLGDMVAGTLVVRVVKTALPTLNKHKVEVPPQIRAVAWSLPGKEVEIIKAFLKRRKIMKDEKREQLGHALAEKIAEKLSLPKQDIVDATQFLEQVLAGYALGALDKE